MCHRLGRHTMKMMAVKPQQAVRRCDPQVSVSAACDACGRGRETLGSKRAGELTHIRHFVRCPRRPNRGGRCTSREDQNRLRPSLFLSHSDANSQSLRTILIVASTAAAVSSHEQPA